ncbi:acetyl-CoA synthetase [Frankia sp. AgB1.9]|uniref:acetyl-CoA synthetase n=1 Tax=unclassified Frankia TaxID=2632575 RepID=UPI0019336161|nr:MULTISPECIES: acetyl-CoA synthetase [unclassified Frankia]MBL7486826.1 acetyl-CoA synthetase [Frankia sp. AgW1.1]MBL7549801.1 acetyl-CoA synthetase [Frankia sp. AgB1.9]MBL7622889.1 acetyl-CoA synthetase [Frankia sp. AgB1.8]
MTSICLIGAAQRTVRETPAPEPLDSWEARAREAAASLPRALADVQSIQVVYCQSWPYDDPVGRLAERLGADPKHRVYSGIGGTVPQTLVNATAAAMLRGELDLALVVGGEALATVRAYKRAGERLPWSHRETPRSPFPWTPPHPAETAHDVLQAWETFPLWDTARRAARGASLADDAAEAARLMAGLTPVAAANPHAWRPRVLDAATVGTATPDNRYVGWPYTKNEVAVMDVDMSAALLLATGARADALGVPEDQRLYLAGWSYAQDPASIAARPDLARSAAMAAAGRAALDRAGLTLAEVGAFDLYSCFPSSLRLGCDALGLEVDDSRGLTVTGGLPYAGGPASGYLLHALASLYEQRPHSALVTGVGMHLQKHVAAVWTCAPARPEAPDDDVVQQGVDAEQAARRLLVSYEGPARVLAYTVAHSRDGGAERGLVVLDTPRGRALARVHEPALLADAESRELVGQPVTVTTDGQRNEARW